jgi:very-short-patch-repair endonuclease
MGELRVTDLHQTLVDLLCRYEGPELLWLLEQALARGADQAAVDGLLARGRRGSVGARRLLGLADSRGESALESAVTLALDGAKIPAPERQWPIVTPQLRARLDFAWPDQMLALEADGVAVHSAPAALLRDRTRQNALAILGWTVLRCTWRDVVPYPAVLVKVVTDALRATTTATKRSPHHAN